MGQSVKSFAINYTPEQRDKIKFSWNGKHAAEFKDENQEYRKAIAEAILAEPAAFPIILVRDILQEDELWSREAWCAPNYYAGLLSVLLHRGGRDYLIEFATAMNATFDTFGASHSIILSEQEARDLTEEVNRLLATETDSRRRALLAGARDLFDKIIKGNASQGWVTLKPGTPVKNIKVVSSSPPAANGGGVFRRMTQSFRSLLTQLFRRS